MSPRMRLRVWTAVVVVAVLAALLALLDDAWADLAHIVCAAGSVGLMVWLLETTPADAMRLRRPTSVGLIAAIAAWVTALTTIPHPRFGVFGAPVAAGLMALAAGGLAVMPGVFVRAGSGARSPWWAIGAAATPWFTLARRGDDVVDWVVLGIAAVGAVGMGLGFLRWVRYAWGWGVLLVAAVEG